MTEALIVGGGLAGAAAATLLAQGGRRVHLVERDAGPRDRICGEFVSGGAQRRLRALGLDPARLTDARIATLRLVAGERIARAPLPFEALGLTRRRLDAALLDHAGAAGARIDRGVAVRAVAGRTVRTTAGDLAPATLLLASGKHDVRGVRRDARRGDRGQVGFKTYWRLPPAARAMLAGHIDIVLFPGGYAGLQLVEGGVANLCVTLRADRLGDGGWPAVEAALRRIPHLARLLGDAEPVLDRPIAISGVPYGYRHRAQAGERVYRLGDQAAVIPSFCGDGMAMALESAFRCADAIGRGAAADGYHRGLGDAFGRQLTVAGWLHRLGLGGAMQPALVALARTAPGLVTRLAAATRVREAARG